MMSKTNAGVIKPFLFFLFLIVILILGCSEKAVRVDKQQQQQPVKEIPVTIDPCTNIICSNNEICFKGDCICEQGFEKCDEACISNESCCTNDDCELNYFCNENNECEEGCNDFLCESNKICDDLTKECTCEPGTRWCENQRKCLSKDLCCTNLDCPRRQNCLPTISFANLCIESEHIVGCEKIREGEEKRFIIKEKKYNVFVKKIYDDDKILLSINKEGIRFNPQEGYKIDSDTEMYSKVIKQFGGECSP